MLMCISLNKNMEVYTFSSLKITVDMPFFTGYKSGYVCLNTPSPKDPITIFCVDCRKAQQFCL